MARPVGGTRHQGRELALKTLFQLESSAEDQADDVLAYHVAEDGASPASADFARELVRGVLENR
ncbi:MAG TPA: N utilization substance protein B, partial [Candidatus Dormibacteraeota bacterium]